MINIFAVIAVLFYITCGYYIGKFLSGYFGTTGWITGFLAGFSLAIAIHCWVMFLLKKKDQIIRRKRGKIKRK